MELECCNAAHFSDLLYTNAQLLKLGEGQMEGVDLNVNTTWARKDRGANRCAEILHKGQ